MTMGFLKAQPDLLVAATTEFSMAGDACESGMAATTPLIEACEANPATMPPGDDVGEALRKNYLETARQLRGATPVIFERQRAMVEGSQYAGTTLPAIDATSASSLQTPVAD
jgi:hypothetical protein